MEIPMHAMIMIKGFLKNAMLLNHFVKWQWKKLGFLPNRRHIGDIAPKERNIMFLIVEMNQEGPGPVARWVKSRSRDHLVAFRHTAVHWHTREIYSFCIDFNQWQQSLTILTAALKWYWLNSMWKDDISLVLFLHQNAGRKPNSLDFTSFEL